MKISLCWRKRWAGSCECDGARRRRRVVLKWHFAVFFGVWVMSTGWTILNGTLTDWNLYWLVCGELQTWATERLKRFQTGHKRSVWPNKYRESGLGLHLPAGQAGIHSWQYRSSLILLSNIWTQVVWIFGNIFSHVKCANTNSMVILTGLGGHWSSTNTTNSKVVVEVGESWETRKWI